MLCGGSDLERSGLPRRRTGLRRAAISTPHVTRNPARKGRLPHKTSAVPGLVKARTCYVTSSTQKSKAINSSRQNQAGTGAASSTAHGSSAGRVEQNWSNEGALPVAVSGCHAPRVPTRIGVPSQYVA
eukprot:6005305-Prymnesium_polylepis.1